MRVSLLNVVSQHLAAWLLLLFIFILETSIFFPSENFVLSGDYQRISQQVALQVCANVATSPFGLFSKGKLTSPPQEIRGSPGIAKPASNKYKLGGFIARLSSLHTILY